MDKFIIFIMTPFSSHMTPTYSMANCFENKGFKVVYVSSVRMQSAIESRGFIFQESSLFSESGEILPVDQLVAYVVNKYHPKRCFVETSFWNWALYLIGLNQPFSMIQTWICCNRTKYVKPDNYRLVQQRKLWNYLSNEWDWFKHNQEQNKKFHELEFQEYYKGILRKAGLSSGKRYLTKRNRIGYYKVLDVPELILFPEEFDIPRKKDKATKFIGPFIETNRDELTFDWSKLDIKGKQLVFCALGSMTSMFKGRDEFYERIINAFARTTDYFLIMAVGQGNKTFLNYTLPAHISLCEFAPQIEILRKASLFITHGGAGSIKESIKFGVPMLVYPWQSRSDMYGNADRILYHNLGLLGNIDRDNSEDISSYVMKILSDHSIATSLKRMQQIFNEYEQKEGEIIDSILS